jgi:hypothetical protein
MIVDDDSSQLTKMIETCSIDIRNEIYNGKESDVEKLLEAVKYNTSDESSTV